MDVLGVNMKSKRHNNRSRSKNAIKVVYISSPMKVKTSASEFRALVQELTGKDSDTARIMDAGNEVDNFNEVLDHPSSVDDGQFINNPSMNSYNESPTSSDSIFEPFDGFLPSMGGSFTNLLQPSFFHESSLLDVFN